MNISEVLQNENALIVCRSGDLKEFASVLFDQYNSQKDNIDTPVKPKEPVSQSEAMKRLNRSRQTLVKWRRKGLLKGFLIGGRVYFQPEELDALQRIKRS